VRCCLIVSARQVRFRFCWLLAYGWGWGDFGVPSRTGGSARVSAPSDASFGGVKPLEGCCLPRGAFSLRMAIAFVRGALVCRARAH